MGEAMFQTVAFEPVIFGAAGAAAAVAASATTISPGARGAIRRSREPGRMRIARYLRPDAGRSRRG